MIVCNLSQIADNPPYLAHIFGADIAGKLEDHADLKTPYVRQIADTGRTMAAQIARLAEEP